MRKLTFSNEELTKELNRITIENKEFDICWVTADENVLYLNANQGDKVFIIKVFIKNEENYTIENTPDLTAGEAIRYPWESWEIEEIIENENQKMASFWKSYRKLIINI